MIICETLSLLQQMDNNTFQIREGCRSIFSKLSLLNMQKINVSTVLEQRVHSALFVALGKIDGNREIMRNGKGERGQKVAWSSGKGYKISLR
jgi:hypothetical protein